MVYSWCIYIYTHMCSILFNSKFEAQCCHKQNSFQKASKHWQIGFQALTKLIHPWFHKTTQGFDVCNGEVLCVRRESKYKMLFRPVQCHAIAAMVAMSRKWDPDVNFMNSHISCHEKSQEPLRFRPIYANFSHFTHDLTWFHQKMSWKKNTFFMSPGNSWTNRAARVSRIYIAMVDLNLRKSSKHSRTNIVLTAQDSCTSQHFDTGRAS